ncbi:DUF4167 domain-containing protein [Vineibacter terrae]|uniref:DUF4167 domain-containing protein n=1 Tax=Vineibacter terrae TaxID=2586908 RepID=UPI002E3009CC|nr:DUF4167 domain-containing protein [Vineibacter terrae]HEX2890499.1 DUF4167 domain-containing protein [Vineibacter terrae]
MRPNHQRRQRGRNGKPNKFPNRNQSYDSNGPDVRVRGTAHQIYEKYQALAREAATSGDRVMAEAYYQHAEHYFRIIQAQGGFVQPRYPQPWEDAEASEDGGPGGDGSAVDAGMGGGMDPADGPQPGVDYAQQGGGSFGQGDDYQPQRDGAGYNGDDRYRGRDDNRGGDGRGEGRGYDRRQDRQDRQDRPDRQDRREDDGGGSFGQRGGRRDFVTRSEQRYQDRQERFERPAAAGEGRPATAAADNAADNNVAPSEPAPEVPPDAPAPDAAAADGAAADNRGQREGRPFRPRHPHFRRFRGGPRGQNGVDPAQQDQPELTGTSSGGSGSGT